MDYSLQEILDNVEQIREAIYGEEVRGSISDSIEMMAYETDTIQNFKDGVDKTLADFKAEYEQGFRDFADSIHRDMNQFETKINEDFAGFKSEVNREINNHKTEMDNAFFEFKQSVHLTIADFTNDMTAKMDLIQDEWIKFQQNTNLEISNFKMEMQNKYQEFTETIIKENSALKESVKTDIAGMKNDIMKFEESTNQTLAQYQQELGETITSWDKTLTDKLAQHTTEMESIKKEIYDKLDEASQADPNLELVDAREGETTLKENLNKNYVKQSKMEEYVAEEIYKESLSEFASAEVGIEPVKLNSHPGVIRISNVVGKTIQDPDTLAITGVNSIKVTVSGENGEQVVKESEFIPCLHHVPGGEPDVFNEGVITRNTGTMKLDGSELWRESNASSETCLKVYMMWSSVGGQFSGNCFNSHSAKQLTYDEYWKQDIEGWFSDTAFSISIKRDKLETPDVAGWKKYLSEHNIIGIFNLREQRLETYDIESIPCFRNSTVSVETPLNTTATVRYPNTIGGRVGILEDNLHQTNKVVQELGGRTTELENLNPVLTINNNAPDDTGNIDISGGNIEATEVTYSELTTLIADSKLVTGGIYLLTDYQTIYRQPISNEIKSGETEELYLTATSTNTLSPTAYSKQYPQDIIIYDIYNNIAEDKTTPRPGFIIWRKDTKRNNEAPYDFRRVLWVRYKVHGTKYLKDGVEVDYEVFVPKDPVTKGSLYKADNKIYISNRDVPKDIVPSITSFPFSLVITNTELGLLTFSDMSIFNNDTVKIQRGELVQVPTFGELVSDSIIQGQPGELSNNVIYGKANDATYRNIIGAGCNHNTLGYQCSENRLEHSSSNYFMNYSKGNIVQLSSFNFLGGDCVNNKLYRAFNNRLMYECTLNQLDKAEYNILYSANNRNKISGRGNIFQYSASNCELAEICNDNIIGDSTVRVTLGKSSIQNTIGQNCKDIHLGSNCSSNRIQGYSEDIKFGENCYSNVLSDYCKQITFDQFCAVNTIDSLSTNITFNSNCQLNTIEDNCKNISFGSECNQNKLQSKSSNITMTTNCRGNTLGANCGSVHFLGNVINCKFGTDMYSTYIYNLNGKDVTQVSGLYNKDYDIIIQKGIYDGQPKYYYSYKDTYGEDKVTAIP